VKKIPSVFQRNHDSDRLLRDEVTPGCEWVLAGEGVATRKWDGTAVMVAKGALYKRYDARRGKTPPPGFIPCQTPDPVTGHWPGWVVASDGPNDRWIRLAYENETVVRHGSAVVDVAFELPDGTYEACGPMINGNRERFDTLRLMQHGEHVDPDVPRAFAALRAYLAGRDLEGYVFHHPDGRMAKVKLSDFGLVRGQR